MSAISVLTKNIELSKIPKVPYPIIFFTSVWGLSPDEDLLKSLKILARKNDFFLSTFTGVQIKEKYTSFGYKLHAIPNKEFSEEGSVRITCYRLEEGCLIFQEWIEDIVKKRELSSHGKIIRCPSELDGYILYEVKRGIDSTSNTLHILQKTFDLFGKKVHNIYSHSVLSLLSSEESFHDFDTSQIVTNIKNIQENSMRTPQFIHSLLTIILTIPKTIGTETEEFAIKYFANLCESLLSVSYFSKLKPHPISHALVPTLAHEILKLITTLNIGKELISDIEIYAYNIIKKEEWIKEKAIYTATTAESKVIIGPIPSFMGANIMTAKKVIEILNFGEEIGIWKKQDYTSLSKTLEKAFISNPIFSEDF